MPIALSCVIFVYKLSTCNVIRNVWGGSVVCARVFKICKELSIKEGIDLISGCKRLLIYADAVCVGPRVHETIGMILPVDFSRQRHSKG